MRRVAMIKGASRGIGAATALVLAERGVRVSLTITPAPRRRARKGMAGFVWTPALPGAATVGALSARSGHLTGRLVSGCGK